MYNNLLSFRQAEVISNGTLKEYFSLIKDLRSITPLQNPVFRVHTSAISDN